MEGDSNYVEPALRSTPFFTTFRRAPVWWGLFAVWFVVLMSLSSLPSRDVPMPPLPFADKVIHFGYFVGGGIFLGLAFSLTFPLSPKSIIAAGILVLAMVAALDEWHQLYVPGRSGGDLADWAADVAGAVAGMVVALKIYGRFQESREAGR